MAHPGPPVVQEGNLTYSSPQADVQERAATALATFVVIGDENASIDTLRAEAAMRDGGIRLLLDLARSWREGLQSEAAKAIANLSVNANVAKAVAEEGGISILVDLARSVNRLVTEEAAGGLWNLSVGEDHKGSIAEAGGVKTLVDLIYKWSSSSGGDGVLECAAGALANLAADDKCSLEVASVGGLHALVTLARSGKVEGVHEQAARALAKWPAHGDSNSNNAAVVQEEGALEALLQLIRSPHDGALWNLSFGDRNREAIAGSGGVEALVALASSCSNSPHVLQERAAGALWGLSVSEANRMDEIAVVGTSAEGTSKGVNLDAIRKMALKHIEAFVMTFSDPQAFAAAAASSAPAALAQVTESAHIQEVAHLRCREKLTGTDWTLVATNDAKRYCYNSVAQKKLQGADGPAFKLLSRLSSSMSLEESDSAQFSGQDAHHSNILRYKSSVWMIRCVDEGESGDTSQLTGFCVDKRGIIFTCAHGIVNGWTIKVSCLQDDNKFYDARVVKISRGWDIALLMVEAKDEVFDFVNLADEEHKVSCGQEVHVIGNVAYMLGSFYTGTIGYPFEGYNPALLSGIDDQERDYSCRFKGVEHHRRIGNTAPVLGNVAIDRHENLPFIQVNNIPCVEGSSGSPVLTDTGVVVGMC